MTLHHPFPFPLSPITHSESALCAFTCALRQPSSTHAGRDPPSYPGASVAVRPHHGLHRVAPDTHGSLEEGEETESWRGIHRKGGERERGIGVERYISNIKIENRSEVLSV